MKKERLLRKLNIRPDELDAIQAAVAEAEMKTNGEIALAVIPQSDSYSFVEFFAAMCLGFMSFFTFLLFADRIWALLEQNIWYPSPKMLAAVIGLGVLAVILFFFVLLNIPAFDRMIIPKRLKKQRVYARALQHFVECGIYKTAERSGILIFVSVLEREVFVIADSGIAEKVKQEEWAAICKTVTGSLKARKAAEGFCAAALQCGTILAEYFPKTTDDQNEYPDGLVVLER